MMVVVVFLLLLLQQSTAFSPNDAYQPADGSGSQSDPASQPVIHGSLTSLQGSVSGNVSQDTANTTEDTSLNGTIVQIGNVSVDQNTMLFNHSEIGITTASSHESMNTTDSTSSGEEQWTTVHNHPELLPVFFPMVWSGIIQAGWDIDWYNVSADCKVELYAYVVDLKRRADWATNMYDATGKQGPGLLKGSVTWIGNYDQCRSVHHSMTSRKNSDVTRIIRAQYCSVSFSTPGWLERYIERLKLPFPVHLPYLTVDICVPSGCREEDITTIVQQYKVEFERNISLVEVRCHDDEDIGSDGAAVFTIWLLSTIACCVLFGSIITMIIKLTTPKGDVKETTLVGYFSKRGSIFSVARQNSILQRKSSTLSHRKSSTLSHRGSVYCKRVSTIPALESSKVSTNNNMPPSPSMVSSNCQNEANQNGDVSPEVQMREHTFNEAVRSPVIRRESLILQNGTLGPISELPVSNPEMKANPSPVHLPKTSRGKEKIGGIITDFFLCFSFPVNVTSVLGEGNTNHLFCLSGVRFLSISWIVLGNTLSFVHKAPDAVENNVVGVELAQSLWFQAIINSTFAADTFFILSGTLLSYNFMRGVMKQKAKGESFKVTPKFIAQFYLHRFIRIAPCYYVAVTVFTNLLPYLGHGPRWPYVSKSIDQCKRHWWANVLFVSNFYMADDMCMSWTYYLVNDFQFYLISPLILVPLVRIPRLGFSLLAGLVAVQIVSVGVLNNKINGNMLRMDGGYFSEVYAKPYCRVGVFAIGMALGYILNKVGRKVYLRKIPLLLGWLASGIIMSVVVFITYHENQTGGSEWSSVQTAVYEAFSRPAWGLAVSWLIFACSIGQGGFIHKFLSWNFFLPLCRITYGIYLFHPLVIIVVIHTSRNLIYLSPIDLWLLFVPILITATMVALVIISCVEGPFIRLEKLVRTLTS